MHFDFWRMVTDFISGYLDSFCFNFLPLASYVSSCSLLGSEERKHFVPLSPEYDLISGKSGNFWNPKPHHGIPFFAMNQVRKLSYLCTKRPAFLSLLVSKPNIIKLGFPKCFFPCAVFADACAKSSASLCIYLSQAVGLCSMPHLPKCLHLCTGCLFLDPYLYLF